ncbi:MAG TPA: L-erythro-3,5-diaminohexanoate dehydrogenase [Trebonia sp.]|jgi:L-erythro-3,5-diaminohexanoate dehydrogenase|nr:L-erythro-3,5-diaminohexanoate dehydrogenase [Trebonia sp.]
MARPQHGPRRSGSPGHGAPLATSLGLGRVADPAERLAGVLPQAAWRLDTSPRLGADEVRIRVDRLNLDAASYRQLSEANNGDGDAIREAVREIIGSRGKMHNPVTGSGGMLTGVVDEAGPESPLGLKPGDRVATLVSLTLTPLEIYDGLARWDGLSEQVPCEGHAILFGRSIAAVLPGDLPVPLSLAVMDVCGAPALTKRVVEAWGRADVMEAWGGADVMEAWGGAGGEAGRRQSFRTPPAISPRPPAAASEESAPSARPGPPGPVVAILGAAGKSGSLSAAAARAAGARHIIGVVPTEAEASLLRSANAIAPLADEVVVADARRPVPLAEAVAGAGGPADVTVVCVDVAGCEGGAILSTAQGGTVIFFSMATSFSAAALGAEGVAADVTMLIGTGYTPGHAGLALNLIRTNKAVRALFTRRLGEDGAPAPGRPALSSPDECPALSSPDECDIQPPIGGSMPHSSGRRAGEGE